MTGGSTIVVMSALLIPLVRNEPPEYRTLFVAGVVLKRVDALPIREKP
jgi:hypothetical protein